jgi:hypothetical protein
MPRGLHVQEGGDVKSVEGIGGDAGAVFGWITVVAARP